MENLNYPLSLKALSIHFQHTAIEQAKIPQLKDDEVLLPREVASKVSDTLSKTLRKIRDAGIIESYYNWISTVSVEEPKILTNLNAYQNLSFYVLNSPLPAPLKERVYNDFKHNYIALLNSNSIPTSSLEQNNN
jgi:hypothetical protein